MFVAPWCGVLVVALVDVIMVLVMLVVVFVVISPWLSVSPSVGVDT